MKLARLSGRKVCERVMSKGIIWKGRTLLVRWMAPEQNSWFMLRIRSGNGGVYRINTVIQGVYIGTYASNKLDKSAVRRNRMRRRCREAFRMEVKKLSDFPPLLLLVTPRSRSLDASFAEIQKDVRDFLSNVYLCLKKAN